MKTRRIVWILFMAAVLALTGCGGKSAAPAAEKEEAAASESSKKDGAGESARSGETSKEGTSKEEAPSSGKTDAADAAGAADAGKSGSGAASKDKTGGKTQGSGSGQEKEAEEGEPGKDGEKAEELPADGPLDKQELLDFETLINSTKDARDLLFATDEHAGADKSQYRCVEGRRITAVHGEEMIELRVRKDLAGRLHMPDHRLVLSRSSKEAQWDFVSDELLWEEGKIAEHCFDVTMTEFGSVRFIAYDPKETPDDDRDVTLLFMRDGKILQTLPAALDDDPELSFGSLRTVSFPDYNSDGATDLVTVSVYSRNGTDMEIPALYQGVNEAEGDGYLFYDRNNSEKVMENVSELTAHGITDYLKAGQRQKASYEDWKEAYRTVIEENRNESGIRFALTDVDGDELPELLADWQGFRLRMYTWKDSHLAMPMEDWPYGAAGNMGYDYIPGENIISNINNDLAGAIRYYSYYRLESDGTMKDALDTELVVWAFQDGNHNYMIDDGEYSKDHYFYYVGDKEVTEEEFKKHLIQGDFQPLCGELSADEILEELDSKY